MNEQAKKLYQQIIDATKLLTKYGISTNIKDWEGKNLSFVVNKITSEYALDSQQQNDLINALNKFCSMAN